MRLSIPKDARHVHNFPDGWSLYELPMTAPGATLFWMRFKLANPARRRQRGRWRAHYLTWGTDAQRLRRDKQTKVFAEQEPELYEAVLRYFAEAYGPNWLAEDSMMTAAEIEAERAALAEKARARADERIMRKLLS